MTPQEMPKPCLNSAENCLKIFGHGPVRSLQLGLQEFLKHNIVQHVHFIGIGGAGEMSLSQIGKELGITRERVRQIEVRAREKLRGLVRTEELDLLLA